MRIKYNAPTTLSFAFFCTLTVAVDQFLFHGFIRAFFTVPSALQFDILKPLDYLRMFTHIAGHADWNHLLSNLAYILLLGPMLEETYGSITMFLMIIVTGFVTGVLNACFFPHPLLGASGVVFMMILLASFTNHGKNDVPLTFILIVILYLGREFLNAFRGDDISQFAHLAGGLCGSLFGFFRPRPAPRRAAAPKTSAALKTPASADAVPRNRAEQSPPAANMRNRAEQSPPAASHNRAKSATPARSQQTKASASLKPVSDTARSAQPARRKPAADAMELDAAKTTRKQSCSAAARKASPSTEDRKRSVPEESRTQGSQPGEPPRRSAGKTRKTQSDGN